MENSPGALTKHEYLSKSELFAGLSAEQVAAVEQMTKMEHCQRGQLFFSPDDPPGTMYLLKEGSVRLYRCADDRRKLTVAVLDPGSFFGESAMLGRSNGGLYAEAIEPCLVCIIPGDKLRELIMQYPVVGLNLIEYLGERLQRSQELSEEMAFWSVQRRLAHQLLLFAEKYGHPTFTGGTIINKKFTQGQLAAMLGCSRQTVSEPMTSMTHEDVLGIRRGKILLKDEHALRKIAGESS